MSRVDFQSPPRLVNGRYFYLRRSADQDQAVIIVREGIDGSERVLVDPNQLSPDGSVSALIWDVRPDGRVLAWSRRKGGEDEFEVHLLDVDTASLSRKGCREVSTSTSTCSRIRAASSTRDGAPRARGF